jgi:hypothetical protein
MENIKELTKKQALEVLKHIWDCYEDYGSSRLVHAIQYNGKYYAVKIIADEQGRFQNRTEIDLFKEHGDEKFLNPIRWAYKDLMLICDYVYPMDSDLVDFAYFGDIDSIIDYYDGGEVEEYKELCSSVSYVVNSLEEYQGETFDNFQIGYNENGFGVGEKHIVAYDYGYTVGISNSLQVGNMYRYLPNEWSDEDDMGMNVYQLMEKFIMEEDDSE